MTEPRGSFRQRRRAADDATPVLTWHQLIVAMHRARLDDDAWRELRPAAVRSIRRQNPKLDALEAQQVFDAMRKYTPGVPPQDVDDDA